MRASPFDYGFRVVGHKAARRRSIRHAAAFAAYAECDSRAEVEREGYLSHFCFDRLLVKNLLGLIRGRLHGLRGSWLDSGTSTGLMTWEPP